ncbi:hypothetical protein QAD02_007106 [Eretmocerus hayati]|uniref:Uncharacterized protein n=1 Tax=Eretmocerus hayati TaxID=131215 RepID=A0ACC2N315_9HYME|nr:hypothetical protein QAD02_007106 [Eretmocerus hayati]
MESPPTFDRDATGQRLDLSVDKGEFAAVDGSLDIDKSLPALDDLSIIGPTSTYEKTTTLVTDFQSELNGWLHNRDQGESFSQEDSLVFPVHGENSEVMLGGRDDIGTDDVPHGVRKGKSDGLMAEENTTPKRVCGAGPSQQINVTPKTGKSKRFRVKVGTVCHWMSREDFTSEEKWKLFLQFARQEALQLRTANRK